MREERVSDTAAMPEDSVGCYVVRRHDRLNILIAFCTMTVHGLTPYLRALCVGSCGLAGDVELGAFQGGSVRTQEVQRVFQGFLLVAGSAALEEFSAARQHGRFCGGDFLGNNAFV